MKTIVCYNPYWSTFGGGEKYVLSLAKALSGLPGVTVTVLSREAGIGRQELERFSNIPLPGVEFRTIGAEREMECSTARADLFIALSNVRRVRSSARRHVQLLQIPYGRISCGSIALRLLRGELREAFKDLYRLQLLSFARREAALVIVNSEYVRRILERNYSIASHVLHPSIQDFHQEGSLRKSSILSVGRFFTGLYNDKRYDILTDAFCGASPTVLKGWEYHIAGSASGDSATQEFLQKLRTRCAGYPVFFHVNESYEALRRLYNEATVFWHAAGFGVDEDRRPENVEHFGMTTVEAMSAGCIPVVVAKGGQREVVTQGVDGYLWESVPELIAKTEDIVRGRIQRPIISENARKRSRDFSFEMFARRTHELFSTIST